MAVHLWLWPVGSARVWCVVMGRKHEQQFGAVMRNTLSDVRLPGIESWL